MGHGCPLSETQMGHRCHFKMGHRCHFKMGHRCHPNTLEEHLREYIPRGRHRIRGYLSRGCGAVMREFISVQCRSPVAAVRIAARSACRALALGSGAGRAGCASASAWRRVRAIMSRSCPCWCVSHVRGAAIPDRCAPMRCRATCAARAVVRWSTSATVGRSARVMVRHAPQRRLSLVQRLFDRRCRAIAHIEHIWCDTSLGGEP